MALNIPRTRLRAQSAPAVLTKAVARAARLLGISQATVASALGISAPTASRMFAGNYVLDRGKKEWELATLFVRLFRSLDSIVGGNDEAARSWLTSANRALGTKPIELVRSAEGLVRVVHYLDAARGRL
jgi:uncharacterized protein (DUF2384 family)